MFTKIFNKVRENKENLKWVLTGLILLILTAFVVNYVRAFLNDKYNKPNNEQDGILYAD